MRKHRILFSCCFLLFASGLATAQQLGNTVQLSAEGSPGGRYTHASFTFTWGKASYNYADKTSAITMIAEKSVGPVPSAPFMYSEPFVINENGGHIQFDWSYDFTLTPGQTPANVIITSADVEGHITISLAVVDVATNEVVATLKGGITQGIPIGEGCSISETKQVSADISGNGTKRTVRLRALLFVAPSLLEDASQRTRLSITTISQISDTNDDINSALK